MDQYDEIGANKSEILFKLQKIVITTFNQYWWNNT